CAAVATHKYLWFRTASNGGIPLIPKKTGPPAAKAPHSKSMLIMPYGKTVLRSPRLKRAPAMAPETTASKAVLVHTGWSEHWGTERYFHGHPFRARAHSHAVVMWQIVAMNAASRSPLLASSTGASL